MKTLFAITIFSLFVFAAFGQENNSYKKRAVRVSGIYIQPGIEVQPGSPGTLNDFRQLAPQSQLLANDFSDYNERSSRGISSDGFLALMMELQFRAKDKESYRTNPFLRLGLTYSSNSILSHQLESSNRQRFDTLVSSQTGQSSYVDSVYSETYMMSHFADQVRISASLIFRTNPEARWSVYAGVGLNAGVSINSYTSILYNQNTSTEIRHTNGDKTIHSHAEFGEPKHQKVENKTNFGFAAYIPLGVDFRLGKQNAFWKRMHLFFEFNPALQINTIPDLYTVTNVSLSQGLGLRVTF